MDGHSTALVGLLGEPQVEGADELRVDLDGSPRLDHAHAQRRRHQAGELLLEGSQLLAVRLQTERLGEGGHRLLDVDYRRAGTDGFRGEMNENQTRFLAVGQSELAECAGPGVDSRPGLDAQCRVALLAVPFAHVVAGIAVRDAALTLDGMKEVDAVGWISANGRRGVQKSSLLSGKCQPGEILGHVRPTRQFR